MSGSTNHFRGCGSATHTGALLQASAAGCDAVVERGALWPRARQPSDDSVDGGSCLMHTLTRSLLRCMCMAARVAARRLLGVSKDASFEEIQDARNYLHEVRAHCIAGAGCTQLPGVQLHSQ